MKKPGIVVINYGGQYAPQIGKFVRQLGVWSETVLSDIPLRYFDNALGIIHSGSWHSVFDKDAPLPDAELLELPISQFGFCYGQQAMQHVLGGEVVRGSSGEYGVTDLRVLDKSDIFNGLGDIEPVLMSHRDIVIRPAPGHECIGYTVASPNAALRDSEKRLFGVQFHPEVHQTPSGRQIISNFLDICGCKRNWSPSNLVEEKVERIRREVGDGYAVVLVSGGKDSTVTALLAQRALEPEKVFYLHVDTGLQRRDEAKHAKETLQNAGITRNVQVIDASQTFFKRLYGVSEPNEKRIIIGDTFYDVVMEFAADKGLPKRYKVLQGSIFTDKVESSAVTGKEDQIKIHHNINPRSRELRKQGRMIEPLSDFYKDDVKRFAPRVGTPAKVTEDEPMPGPGFGVRTKCIPQDFTYDVKKLDKINRQANVIVEQYGLRAHVRPYTTVGVQGDTRTEVHPAIIEGKIDEYVFKTVSKELPNSIKEISRVWYLLQPQKVSSIELITNKFITPDRIGRLRKLEYHIKLTLKLYQNESDSISQFPVFLIPDSINNGNELIVLRPFHSLDYMTGESVWLPSKLTDDIVNTINKVDGSDKTRYERGAVALEGEGKPPGTTELE